MRAGTIQDAPTLDLKESIYLWVVVIRADVLLVAHGAVGLKRVHSQNFAIEVVAHVLAATHNVAHVKLQHRQKLSEQLIASHLVNKD